MSFDGEGPFRPLEMTREQMAQTCENAKTALVGDGSTNAWDGLDAAAAELRKTCESCRNAHVVPRVTDNESGVSVPGFLLCRAWASEIPADGSGHCHRHDPKPATEAGHVFSICPECRWRTRDDLEPQHRDGCSQPEPTAWVNQRGESVAKPATEEK